MAIVLVYRYILAMIADLSLVRNSGKERFEGKTTI